MERGRAAAAQQTVRKLPAAGLDVAAIAKFVELSDAEVASEESGASWRARHSAAIAHSGMICAPGS